jgi:hypothetical protein
MTRLTVFGAVAALATALASPAMAQEVISNPGYCAQFYPDANCQNKGPGNPYTGDYQRHLAYRAHRAVDGGWNGNWNNGWRQGWNDSPDFWRGNAYASNKGPYASGGYDANAHAGDGWSGRHGTHGWFVCTPGSYFRGEDGRRHLCQ